MFCVWLPSIAILCFPKIINGDQYFKNRRKTQGKLSGKSLSPCQCGSLPQVTLSTLQRRTSRTSDSTVWPTWCGSTGRSTRGAASLMLASSTMTCSLWTAPRPATSSCDASFTFVKVQKVPWLYTARVRDDPATRSVYSCSVKARGTDKLPSREPITRGWKHC